MATYKPFAPPVAADTVDSLDDLKRVAFGEEEAIRNADLELRARLVPQVEVPVMEVPREHGRRMADAPPAGRPAPDPKEDFVGKMKAALKKAAPHLSPRAQAIAIAHAAYESGYGKGTAWQKGNNPYNITRTAQDRQRVVLGADKEYGKDGSVRDITQRFAAYNNPEEAVSHYLQFLSGPRYRRALEALEAGDAEGFANRLSEGGYYTLPVDQYRSGLMGVLKRVGAEDEQPRSADGLTETLHRIRNMQEATLPPSVETPVAGGVVPEPPQEEHEGEAILQKAIALMSERRAPQPTLTREPPKLDLTQARETADKRGLIAAISRAGATANAALSGTKADTSFADQLLRDAEEPITRAKEDHQQALSQHKDLVAKDVEAETLARTNEQERLDNPYHVAARKLYAENFPQIAKNLPLESLRAEELAKLVPQGIQDAWKRRLEEEKLKVDQQNAALSREKFEHEKANPKTSGALTDRDLAIQFGREGAIIQDYRRYLKEKGLDNIAPMMSTIQEFNPGAVVGDLNDENAIGFLERLAKGMPLGFGSRLTGEQAARLNASYELLGEYIKRPLAGANLTDSEKKLWDRILMTGTGANPEAQLLMLDLMRRDLGRKLHHGGSSLFTRVSKPLRDAEIANGLITYQHPLFSDMTFPEATQFGLNEYLGGQGSAPPPPTAPVASPPPAPVVSRTVKVRAPDGKVRNIPEDRVQEALANGGTLVGGM